MITKIEKLSPNSALVVNKIEDLPEKSLEFLSFREKLTLSNITHPEKHKEFIASRKVMNEALRCFDIKYPGFYKDEFGKSYPMEDIGHVSLTHTKGFVAAIFHKLQPVGIDLEHIQDKIVRLGPKFLSPLEIDRLGNDPVKITMSWSSKEAAYKVYGKKGISLKNNIRIVQEDLKESVWHLQIETHEENHLIFPIQIEVHDDMVLSYSKW